ncbi:MAG: DUF1987 domain-containing protein [Cytophagales bacterium]|nr:DUF1987 domain-containing protein [Cytophagales bacterium]
MEKLTIQKTSKTPGINLDPDKGLLEISGYSISKFTKEFYEPVLKWIDEYSKKPHEETLIRLKFYYYNTGTAMYILDILRKLEALYKKGFKVKVEWQYEKEDEDSMEYGQDFRDILSLPFEVVEVEDPD